MNDIDWTKSMQQTFEFFKVDPITWFDTDKLTNIQSATVGRDINSETLGSCTLDGENISGEFYVRIYLVCIQNHRTFRYPLGTFLIQTASLSFDGKRHQNSVDAYTPLIELKEKYPPIGYYIPWNENIMNRALDILRENCRAKIPQKSLDLRNNIASSKGFVADPNDTWLKYVSDLIEALEYRLDLDPMGQILFKPREKTESMQPVWTYTDDNSSILYASVEMDRDLYGVPNVVEIIYSTEWDVQTYVAKNENPNSPTSIPSRGREVVHRQNSPNAIRMNETQLKEYAEQILEELSSIECTLKYTHGYCPVRVGDCIRFDYKLAGYHNIKAMVTKQSIQCDAGCSVTETAVFTTNLWRD